jgi:aryl-alcohol dehydrogenase-like predicted oxidoreductase
VIGPAKTAASGSFMAPGSKASRRGLSPHQLVLAWILGKSPVVIPIPGARREASARDSAGAADVELSPAEVATIEATF